MAALAIGAMLTIGCDRSKVNQEGMQTYIDSVYETFPSDTVEAELPGDSITPPDSTATTKTDTVDVAAPAQEAAEPAVTKKVYAKSEDGYVNVRSKPSAQSEKLGQLTVGGPGVKYLATEGDWTKIEYKGREAYMKSCYVSTDSVVAAAKAKPADGKLYYVVIASFSELEGAKKTTDKLPAEFKSPVYKSQKDGKTMYRICESCYDTKEKAQARINQLNKRFGNSDLWIWEVDSKASCVYTPTASDGKKVSPLTPR